MESFPISPLDQSWLRILSFLGARSSFEEGVLGFAAEKVGALSDDDHRKPVFATEIIKRLVELTEAVMNDARLPPALQRLVDRVCAVPLLAANWSRRSSLLSFSDLASSSLSSFTPTLFRPTLV